MSEQNTAARIPSVDKIGKIHIGVFTVIWLAFMTSNVDRFAWGSVMPTASADLGLSGAGAGGLMTAFFIGYICTQIPGGYLADRFGYRRVLLTSFLVMGFFTAMMGTVESYKAGFIYRLMAGLGSGCVYASSLRAIFEWFPERSRGTVIGLFLT
ncbi:MAG: MFS transporter, partial [Candidatus Adiutrix sp.]|nr:MFS transporter [Candidatus Adiutrix sp.]